MPLRTTTAQLKKSRSEANRDKSCMALVPYLHHDIWFDIFLWLSASCLHNIVNRVCKSWATIISRPDFVDTHLRRSTYGIFLQSGYNSSRRFLEIVNNNVEITEMNLKIKCLGEPCSTNYQGVMLFMSDSTVDSSYYVLNPVTRQIAKIYKPEIPTGYYYYDDCDRCSVIRDRRSGEYKLVCGFYNWSGSCRERGWYVTKLGSGYMWDKIITEERFRCPGLSVGGFLCYTANHRRTIVILDVSDKTVCTISCPGGYSPRTYLPMGHAATLSSISFDSKRIFVHVLTDLRVGNWSLYHILDTESLYRGITGPRYRGPKSPEFIRFYGWINNDEELVGRLCTHIDCFELGSCYKYGEQFKCSNYECHCCTIEGPIWWEDKWIYFTYNPKTKHTRYLDRYISDYEIVRVHTNTLVSW